MTPAKRVVAMWLEGEYDLKFYAEVAQTALDNAYHYGKSPAGSFGEAANLSTAKYILSALENGERDLEKLSDAAHRGYSAVALAFADPVYQQKPEKRQARIKLANTAYANLPEHEKEKDRVAARAIMAEYLKNYP